MHFLRCTIIILIYIFTFNPLVLAESLKGNIPEGPDTTIRGSEVSWYAIVKIGTKKKLFTKGDIFYSNTDITKCLRILDIKMDCLILDDINSQNTLVVTSGERIPLEGSDIIFEKTVATDTIRYNSK